MLLTFAICIYYNTIIHYAHYVYVFYGFFQAPLISNVFKHGTQFPQILSHLYLRYMSHVQINSLGFISHFLVLCVLSHFLSLSRRARPPTHIHTQYIFPSINFPSVSHGLCYLFITLRKHFNKKNKWFNPCFIGKENVSKKSHLKQL